jgi:formate/nitrite transporter FocA (FNT family)
MLHFSTIFRLHSLLFYIPLVVMVFIYCRYKHAVVNINILQT